MTPQELRNDLLTRLNLVCETYSDLEALTGTAQEFLPRKRRILAEGLFMNGWSSWEGFLKELLVTDLAREAGGTVGKIATAESNLGARR